MKQNTYTKFLSSKFPKMMVRKKNKLRRCKNMIPRAAGSVMRQAKNASSQAGIIRGRTSF